jgi:hypothetical protein
MIKRSSLLITIGARPKQKITVVKKKDKRHRCLKEVKRLKD